MNKQLWTMYKESSRGKTCVELFNPEKEDFVEGAFKILQYSSEWGADPVEDSFIDRLDRILSIWDVNFTQRGFYPEEWTKESFMKFSEEYDILYPKQNENGEVEYDEDDFVVFDEEACVLRKDQYRYKASNIPILSLLLYYTFEYFKPILLPRRFDIIQRNCNALGIDLPEIPRSNDYKAYIAYYYDICETWNSFKKYNEMSY